MRYLARAVLVLGAALAAADAPEWENELVFGVN